MRGLLSAAFGCACVAAACGSTFAQAQTMFHRAENGVPVAMVGAARTASYTEIRLETEAALNHVCWYAAKPNSPYLLAGNRRYAFLGGDNIATCPGRQDYRLHEIMTLRFQQLPAGVHEFSLVEGEGGENQMINPTAHPGETFWNFLRVPLD